MSSAYPAIPYGRASFSKMRLDGCLYVDKTSFIPLLENERHVFFIRPRRFGKTCFLGLLERYYDRASKERFESLFGGTEVGRNRTENRSRYVILYFDFSAIKDDPETLEDLFEEYCHRNLRAALEHNPDIFPAHARQRILAPPSITGKLNELFLYAQDHDVALYALIDEYDNFANTVIAVHGSDAYHAFTHGGGFYRSFFAALKAGTARSGGLERLFITGVSPITMDDVTSGFNIGTNLSFELEFNEMLGFTEAEVKDVLRLYRDRGVLDENVDAALATMREWYNGYRFAEDAEQDVYNPDMVLYYLRKSIPNKRVPKQLIDPNVRIDYAKLRHLLVVSRDASIALNGNFDLLRHIVGEQQASGALRESFPLDRLGERENFLSLLHCFGLLSIRGSDEGLPLLGIPNQTVKQLMFGYLRDAYKDVGAFAVDVYDFSRLMHEMAYRGAWQPVIEFLASAIKRQTAIRDYISGERVLQGFFSAYLGVTDYFLFRSERELNGGYADICLEPFLAGHPQVPYGYLIELKYLKTNEGNEKTIKAAADQAFAQLTRYLADEALARQYPAVRFLGLAIVFQGRDMVFLGAVAAASSPP